MKSIKSPLILLLCSLPLHAQIELDRDVVETVKMLAVAQGDVKALEQINETIKEAEEDCPPEAKTPVEEKKEPFVLVESKGEKENKWSFSVRSTLTGPREKLEKNFSTPDRSDELAGRLEKIIQTEYGNHDDRLKAISKTCEGLEDMDKVGMASLLAGRLGRIYDHSRVDGQNQNIIVKPSDQWDALRTRDDSGVCRDAAMTVAQFALACGLRKDQVVLKSYATEDTGHMVTAIGLELGEYTINWSELYKLSNHGLEAPDPNIPNTGLYYRMYDPETGKLLEEKRTDLARALNIVSGGKDVDPLYTPEMLIMEAGYGNLAAKVFEVETERGDKAKGVGLSYQNQWGNDRAFTNISIGGAYASNDRSIHQGPGIESILNQDIVFFQVESKTQMLFPISKSETSQLLVAPSIRGSAEMAMIKNNYLDKETKATEMHSEIAAGATIYFDSDPIKARMNAEVAFTPSNGIYYSQNGKDQSGMIQSRYIVGGGVSWENDRVVVSGNTDVIISKLEKQYIVGAGIKDKKQSTSCQAMYSVYERAYGRREDYIVSRCQKDFNIQKIGNVSVDFSMQNALSNDREKLIVSLGAKIKF